MCITLSVFHIHRQQVKQVETDGTVYYYDIAICSAANEQLAKQDAKYETAGVVQWESGTDGKPTKPHKVGNFQEAELQAGSK